jgi:hypothetical protein
VQLHIPAHRHARNNKLLTTHCLNLITRAAGNADAGLGVKLSLEKNKGKKDSLQLKKKKKKKKKKREKLRENEEWGETVRRRRDTITLQKGDYDGISIFFE